MEPGGVGRHRVEWRRGPLAFVASLKLPAADTNGLLDTGVVVSRSVPTEGVVVISRSRSGEEVIPSRRVRLFLRVGSGVGVASARPTRTANTNPAVHETFPMNEPSADGRRDERPQCGRRGDHCETGSARTGFGEFAHVDVVYADGELDARPREQHQRRERERRGDDRDSDDERHRENERGHDDGMATTVDAVGNLTPRQVTRRYRRRA